MRLEVSLSSKTVPFRRYPGLSHRLKTLIALSLIAPAGIAQRATSPRQPLSPEVMAVHRLAKRPTATSTSALDTTATSQAVDSTFNSAQGPGPGARVSPGPGCNLFPAPASTGANVGLSYFGPSPSTLNPSLVGPVQLLNSGTVDASNATITLALEEHGTSSVRYFA
jgi:hypothetical protein